MTGLKGMSRMRSLHSGALLTTTCRHGHGLVGRFQHRCGVVRLEGIAVENPILYQHMQTQSNARC